MPICESQKHLSLCHPQLQPVSERWTQTVTVFSNIDCNWRWFNEVCFFMNYEFYISVSHHKDTLVKMKGRNKSDWLDDVQAWWYGTSVDIIWYEILEIIPCSKSTEKITEWVGIYSLAIFYFDSSWLSKIRVSHKYDVLKYLYGINIRLKCLHAVHTM